MNKKMLIESSNPEQVRIATVKSNNSLDELIIGSSSYSSYNKGDIYTAVISRIEPSLEAVFVKLPGDKVGFLPFREVSKQYYQQSIGEQATPSVKEALIEGQVLLVQIEKEERGNKCASLTTFLSLAGCYLVLMPNNPRSGGVSRKIEEQDRNELKSSIESLNCPSEHGLIARTAGVSKSVDELKWDFEFLTRKWDEILKAAKSYDEPTLIFSENNILTTAIRDHIYKDISEIVCDNEATYKTLFESINSLRPEYLDKLRLYQRNIPIFSAYKVSEQVESVFNREVVLPSGGSIVFDQTEALLAVDVNSAKATKGSDIEQTALNNNLEAASEIAKQLRLRSIGGLVIIDFIDMTNQSSQKKVEDRLKKDLEFDKAKTQVGRISKFGLMELSRQRIRPTIYDSIKKTCTMCSGTGLIDKVDHLSNTIARELIETLNKDQTINKIELTLSAELAQYVSNYAYEVFHNIANTNKCIIKYVIDGTLPYNSYKSTYLSDENVKKQQSKITESSSLSYSEEPGVKQIPVVNVAAAKSKQSDSMFTKLWNSFFGTETKKEKPNAKRKYNNRRTNKDANTKRGANPNRNNSRNRVNNNRRRGNNNNKNNDKNSHLSVVNKEN